MNHGFTELDETHGFRLRCPLKPIHCYVQKVCDDHSLKLITFSIILHHYPSTKSLRNVTVFFCTGAGVLIYILLMVGLLSRTSDLADLAGNERRFMALQSRHASQMFFFFDKNGGFMWNINSNSSGIVI